MKEITLPSGAILKITLAPFSDSRDLYQAFLEEIKTINFKSSVQEALKDLICYGFSSKRIEMCLEKCFKRCLYNSGNGDLKIDKDTFEPEEARDDYLTVCLEVAKENVMPFTKSLYAKYKPLIETIKKDLA